MRIYLIAFLLFFTVNVNYSIASYKTEILEIEDQKVNVTHWYVKQTTVDSKVDSRSTFILLSGPTDHWNSDSAWFARIAPKLAKEHRVISIDRSGQVLASDNPDVGYTQLGLLLDRIMQKLDVKKIKILSFASANLVLSQYLSQQPNQIIDSIVMIDPDVLLPYSISRYKKDARPFKENLDKNTAYILSGKYDERALEKNNIEKSHLQELAAGDQETDWPYVDEIFARRLDRKNLVNLFREIAIYDQDLDQAFSQTFPSNIPLTIIDTNFEQAYIDKSNDPLQKEGLQKWKAEAKHYYQQLVDKSVDGKYIELKTKEHLLPFSQPELLIRLLE